MRALVWGGLTLYALCVPIAQGSVGAALRVEEQPMAAQNVVSQPTRDPGGAGALLDRMPEHVFGAAAPEASPSSTTRGCGDISPCIAMRETAGVALPRIMSLAAQTTETSADDSQSEAMTVLDLVLMVLFAVGLVGYQLDRKQRELRNSTLFAAPP